MSTMFPQPSMGNEDTREYDLSLVKEIYHFDKIMSVQSDLNHADLEKKGFRLLTNCAEEAALRIIKQSGLENKRFIINSKAYDINGVVVPYMVSLWRSD